MWCVLPQPSVEMLSDFLAFYRKIYHNHSRHAHVVWHCVQNLPNFFETAQLLGNTLGMARRYQVLQCKESFILCWHVFLILQRCKKYRAECTLADTPMDHEYVVYIWYLRFQLIDTLCK